MDANTEWQEIEFCVQPDGKDPVFLQIFYDGLPNNKKKMPLKVQLVAPNGAKSPGKRIKEGKFEKTVGGEAHIYYQVDRPKYIMPAGVSAQPRTMITVAINPTDLLFHENQGLHAAHPGRWKLRVKGTRNLPLRSKIDLWIERGESLAGFPARGRQAYFIHPDYEIYRKDGRLQEEDNGAPIRRMGTLNGFGTAASPKVVASVRASNRNASYFSSAARDSIPYSQQPSFGIFAEKSFGRPNLLASGILSGSMRLARGSSFAAARVAREAALAALNPGAGSINFQINNLIERPSPPDRPYVPRERYGIGTIEADINKGRKARR